MNERARRTENALRRFFERNAGAEPELPRKPRQKRSGEPSEYQEQAAVCDWLKAHGVGCMAVPNGAYLSGSAQQRGIRWRQLARIGAKAGAPDLVIEDPPPEIPGTHVVVEMKRAKGGTLSPEQRATHERLKTRGWIVVVGHGAGDAINKLAGLGYGR
jgi:hypothetical protein